MENVLNLSGQSWTALVATLIAVPILIHLINLWRHRRVRWAAMEFLLASHKKRKNWVRLKQWALLASRVATLLLALLLMSHVGCGDSALLSIFKNQSTEHIVLLDDSFSMSAHDSNQSTTHFQRALESIRALAGSLDSTADQRFTLIPFSATAGHSEGTEASELLPAPISSEPIDRQFVQRLDGFLGLRVASDLPQSAQNALAWVVRLSQSSQGHKMVVHVVSDFQSGAWLGSDEIAQALASLTERGISIRMIRCAETSLPNVAITELKPASNLRVAGYPLMMQVQLKNLGDTTVEKVIVDLSSTECLTADGSRTTSQQTNLPSLLVDRIEPGKTETREFLIQFKSIGSHFVTARIAHDALDPDNRRSCVIDLVDRAKVLVVDQPDQAAALYVQNALGPHGMTGIQCDVRTKDCFRSFDPQRDRYRMICLLDIDSLDAGAVEKLERYVAEGGGLAIFCGPNVDRSFYQKQLWREGAGLLPIPLNSVWEVPQVNADAGDVYLHDHPVNQPFRGTAEAVLHQVYVQKMLIPPPGWNDSGTVSTEIIATLRGKNGYPILAAKPHGRGRVIVCTTTAQPSWSNWALDGSFPLLMLMIEDYLSAGLTQNSNFLVGESVSQTVSTGAYQVETSFAKFESGDSPRRALRVLLDPSSQSPGTSQVTFPVGPPDEPGAVGSAGVYEWILTSSSGQYEVRRWAMNVDTSDSDLHFMSKPQLAALAPQAAIEILRWDQVSPQPGTSGAGDLSGLLLVVLVVVLLAERALAYWNTYHLAV